MRFLSKEKNVFSMNNNAVANYCIEQNERVTVETYDCYMGQINYKNTVLCEEILKKTNPATGPIYVQDINKGDILKVDILKIKETSKGIMYTGKEIGISKMISDSRFLFINEFNDENVKFENINIPINKMIGVIGVAPEIGCISNSTPGRHGGNMDCKKVTENSSLYLPVYQDGALLSLGDVHLAMADGEIGGTGLEINSEVDIMCSKAKIEMELKSPILSNEEGIYYISSSETIEKAIENGIHEITKLFISNSNLSVDEFTKLLSLVCDIQICQLVNPQKTIRIYIPRFILSQLNIVI